MMTNSPPTARPPVIVTDGTCDLPPHFYDDYAIRRVPLRVLFGDESYLSSVDMDLNQFVERLERGDVHPTSSQPTVHEFREVYQQIGADGTPILSVHLSAGLSGTVNAARQAARDLPDLAITVHDAGTLSGALGLQVLTAARAAQAGHTAEQIVPLLEQTHAAGELFFVMDDLTYLVRGGRIGSVQYHAAQLLHIKPVITVSKAGDTIGTYISAGRVRRLKRAVDFFAKEVEKRVEPGGKLRALAVHGVEPTISMADEIIARLDEQYDGVLLEKTYSTPVLGVHVGPHAFALGFVAGDWPV